MVSSSTGKIRSTYPDYIETMKQILPYFLLAVAVVLLFMMWQSNRELEKYRREDNKRSQQVIEAKTAEILTRDRAILKKDSLRKADSLKFRVSQIASNEEINGYKRTIAKLRPLIQDKIDSFPDLREFVSNQDSVILKQDSLLQAQDLYCALQIKDFQEILAIHQQKFEAQAQISEAWMDMATKAQKETKKEKRKKVFWKITSGILTAGIIFVALKE